MSDHRPLHLAPFAACLMLGACASVAPPPIGTDRAGMDIPVSFILVPHAETADSISDDPPLSVAGQLRAEALRAQLADTPLTALYVDEFRRTQDTALPMQHAHHPAPAQRYFSRGPLADTAHQWRRRFSRGNVLVVGEPEAIAPLGSALCDCTITPVQAGETDRMIRIERTGSGRTRVEDGRYGAAP